MKIDKAKDMVAFAVEEKIPIMLWGPPGIGKSSIVAEIAKENKLELIDVRLAQLEPMDLRGFLAPNHDTHKSEWFQPDLLPTEGKGILFLDEIDKAPTAVKNAALQLILDRKLGKYTMPEGWAIVCAGNREEDGAFSTPLGTALTNRMVHAEIEPDVEKWAKWARKNKVEESIIGFLFFQPQSLFAPNGSHAFPSPRSWVMASRMMKYAKDEDGLAKLIGSAISESRAAEFITWHKAYQKIDPREILEKGILPNLKKEEQSVKYAITLATSFYCRKDPKVNLHNVTKFLAILSPDMQVIFLMQQNESMLKKLVEVEELNKVVAPLMEII